MFLLIISFQFDRPGISQLQRALNAALADITNIDQFNLKLIQKYKLDQPSTDVQYTFDLNAPFSVTYCEKCDLTKQIYPDYNKIKNDSILYQLINDYKNTQFKVLVNASESNTSFQQQMDIEMLNDLLINVLIHYGIELTTEFKNNQKLLLITYAEQKQLNYYNYDFFINFKSNFYDDLLNLCNYYPNIHGVLFQTIYNAVNNQTININNQKQLTDITNKYYIRVVENTYHQQIMQQLFKQYNISSNRLVSSLSYQQLLSQTQSDNVIFGDFFMLRQIQLENNKFQQLVQISDEFRQQYYIEPQTIKMHLEQQISNQVLLKQMNIKKQQIQQASTTKFGSILGNQQLLQTVDAAIYQLYTKNYNLKQYPFNLLNTRNNKVFDLYAEFYQQFKNYSDQQTAIIQQDYVQIEDVIQGGQLDIVLQSGYLLVAISNNSLVYNQNSKVDFLNCDSSVYSIMQFEEKLAHFIALVISQYYGKYIQVVFKYYNLNEQGQFLNNSLTNINISTKFLKQGKQGDHTVLNTNLAMGMITYAFEQLKLYQFSNQYIISNYVFVSKSSKSIRNVMEQICSLQFVCQKGSGACEMMEYIGAGSSNTCKFKIVESSNDLQQYLTNQDQVLFGDKYSVLAKSRDQNIGVVNDLKIKSQISFAARKDGSLVFSVKDDYGRKLGVLTTLISLVAMAVVAIILFKFGKQKVFIGIVQ